MAILEDMLVWSHAFYTFGTIAFLLLLVYTLVNINLNHTKSGKYCNLFMMQFSIKIENHTL